MEVLRKDFEYNSFKFHISIKLNNRVEKRKDGKVLHKIKTVLERGGFYCQIDEIETFQIEEFIEKHKQLTIAYIDKINKKFSSSEHQLLENLGFENVVCDDGFM